MRYRRRRFSYRLKRNRLAALAKSHRLTIAIVAFCLLIIFLTVLWGNKLGQKAQQSALERARARSLETPTPVSWVRKDLEDIRAPLVTLPTDNSGISQTLSQMTSLSRMGHRAVSLDLYSQGTPHYTSALSVSLDRQRQPADKSLEISLPRLCANANVTGLYVSGCLVSAQSAQVNPYARQVMASYEAGLVLEMTDSGCDEVLLLGLELSEETLDQVLSFLRTVRENAPTATIGVGLSCRFLLSDPENTGTMIHSLLAFADFCALDLSDSGSVPAVRDKDTEEKAFLSFGQVLTEARVPIALYRLRLLVPAGQESRLDELEQLGYRNLQVVPKH